MRIPQRYVLNAPEARTNVPESASKAVKTTPVIVESTLMNDVGGVCEAEPEVRPENSLASESQDGPSSAQDDWNLIDTVL